MKSINVLMMMLCIAGVFSATTPRNQLENQHKEEDEETIIELPSTNPENHRTLQNNNKVRGRRNRQWLKSHNDLRKKYHELHNTTYVPLQWSRTLKKEARKIAFDYAKTCTNAVPDTKYGFNISAKQGTRNLRTTEEILSGYEIKLDMGRAKNREITQVLWRATEWVGCADVRSKEGAEKDCSFSVCLYARPGNCNMNRFDDWETPTFADASPCTPACPPGMLDC